MPPEAAALAEKIDQEIEEGAAEGGEGAAQEQGDTEEEARIASLMGWKSPKDWKGDPPPGGLKSAKDFLAEVPKVNKAMREANELLRGKMDRIVGQVARLTAAEKNRMSAGQEEALEAAMEAGDIDRAKKILAAARAGGGDAEPDEAPALTAFKDRNAWYGVDDEATAYTAALDAQFARSAGGVKDPDAHMRKVEAGVKKRFPELFGDKAKEEDEEEDDQPRRRAPLVARGGRADRSRAPSVVTAADLTPAQRRAAATMKVSEKDYAAALNLTNKDA